jgi:hypothetical protein
MNRRAVGMMIAILLVSASAKSSFAQDPSYTLTSLGKWSSILRREPQPPMSRLPSSPKVVSYVCGAGTGHSTLCADGTRCCFANDGYYFCCRQNTRCGDDGYCH